MSDFDDLARRAFAAAHSLSGSARRLLDRRVRLGVTGLSRAGKTVFTTALIHDLMHAARLPGFDAALDGQVHRARLVPQPDVTVPRFPFEEHLHLLCRERKWPRSTDRISEIRLEMEIASPSSWFAPAYLNLDIVDYPGEWLLDLMLLGQDFRVWSHDVLDSARLPARAALAAPWLAALATVDNAAPADEAEAARLCEAFKDYLRGLRSGAEAVATTPPGRFLMPGDLAGSPALTFLPLDIGADEAIVEGSFAALMRDRFDAYREHVVKPFFLDHFRKIDRQIVLVDVLAALDGGAPALVELEKALDNVLLAFRIGKNSLLSRLFAPRADKVLFAAAKADHLHHESHDRLNAVLRLLVSRAIRRNEAAGAAVGTLALASVRATREQTVKADGVKTVSGVLEAGEVFADKTFDGETETMIFPGEIPKNPEDVFRGRILPGGLRFPRFRPPAFDAALPLDALALPHIRLDSAVKFLLGDHFA